MARFDLKTGQAIDEQCSINDYLVCSVDPGDQCSPGVGIFCMSVRIIIWVCLMAYNSRLIVRLGPVRKAQNTLWKIICLVTICATARLLREISIVSVPYQNVSNVGKAFDTLWYFLPDVPALFTMFAVYAQKFFSMSSNQIFRARGNYVLYGAHAIILTLIAGAAIATSVGQSLVYPLIGGIVATTTISVAFLVYSGTKVRKQLITTSKSGETRVAAEVATFLRKWAQLAALCLLLFVVSSLAAIIVGDTWRRYSTASCAVMQVAHTVMEAILLGSWVRHVGQVLNKFDSARLQRLTGAEPPNSTTDTSKRSKGPSKLAPPANANGRGSALAIVELEKSSWDKLREGSFMASDEAGRVVASEKSNMDFVPIELSSSIEMSSSIEQESSDPTVHTQIVNSNTDGDNVSVGKSSESFQITIEPKNDQR